MEMWNGKCGILELGLSECAAKMRQSAKAAPAAQKDIQQGKPGAFFLTWKCRLPCCHLSFIMNFNQVTRWKICSQSKPGIYNLTQNYFINRNCLILLYKFMSSMWFGFNVKCVFVQLDGKCTNESCRNDSICIFLVVRGVLVPLIAVRRQAN